MPSGIAAMRKQIVCINKEGRSSHEETFILTLIRDSPSRLMEVSNYAPVHVVLLDWEGGIARRIDTPKLVSSMRGFVPVRNGSWFPWGDYTSSQFLISKMPRLLL